MHGVSEGVDVERPVVSEELHQIERGEVAGAVVDPAVLRTRVRGLLAPSLGAGVPAVDRVVELHAGVAAGPGRLGDLPHQVARLVGLGGLAGDAVTGLPLAVFSHRAHERIGHPHRVVGVLEADGAVGVAVEGSVVAGVDEGVGLFFLDRLAADEGFDVGMVGVEQHHFGAAPRRAAGFDGAGGGVGGAHEGQRTGGRAAARQGFAGGPQAREIDARP